LRRTFDLAQREGLEAKICQEGGKPDHIIISNGGLPTLAVTTGSATEHAPDRLECWSKPATALHDLLETVFDPYRDELSN
jgi:hypothetical protein